MPAHYYAYVLIACVLTLSLPEVNAQDDPADTGMIIDHHEHEEPDKEIPWYTWQSLFDPDFYPVYHIDTTIIALQQYDFYGRGSPFFAGKGNIGHATRPLIFTPPARQGMLLHRHNLYPYYLHNLDSVRFHRPDHVFSELFYVLGSEREQLFHAKHNQRLGNNTYAGLKYKTINSPGRYSHTGSSTSNLMLYLDTKPFERYQAAGAFIINRIFNHESGGLEDHKAFEEDEVQAFMILENAESRTRDLGFRIEQSYQLGFRHGEVSLDEDSVDEDNSNQDNLIEDNPNEGDQNEGDQDENGLDHEDVYRQSFFGLGEVRHTFEYHRQSFVFDETAPPSSRFYEDSDPLNEQFTFDSTAVHNVMNTLRWTNRSHDPDNSSLLRYDFFLRHHHTTIRQPMAYNGITDESEDIGDLHEDSHSRFEPGLRIASNPDRTFSFAGFARYSLGGYHDNDYRIGGHLQIGRDDRRSRIRLKTEYAEEEAPYFMHRMHSNYVRWDNDFRKTKTLHFGAGLLHPLISLEANYYLVDQALFMDTEGYPRQHDHVIHVFNAGLQARLDAGFFRSKHMIVYQVTDENEYESFPSLLTHHSLYASFSLFDNAMKTHVGLDLRYNNPYEPMRYMPMTRHFAIQDTYKTNHDLVADAFLNAYIGRARLFVKLEHIAGILIDEPPVYEIPFYPLPETMFKFGVSWMFFD